MASTWQEHAAWEALPKKERGQEPKAPAEVRLATDDFTPEVLCDLLQVSSKVLLRSDELATVLGAYERYQKAGAINAGRAHMLALYDGGPRRIDRVMRGKMFVENWSAVPVGPYPARQGPAARGRPVRRRSAAAVHDRHAAARRPGRPGRRRHPDRLAARSIGSPQIVEILFALRPPETQGPGGKPEYCVVEAERGVHPIRRRLFRLVERIEADPVAARRR